MPKVNLAQVPVAENPPSPSGRFPLSVPRPFWAIRALLDLVGIRKIPNTAGFNQTYQRRCRLLRSGRASSNHQ